MLAGALAEYDQPRNDYDEYDDDDERPPALNDREASFEMSHGFPRPILSDLSAPAPRATLTQA